MTKHSFQNVSINPCNMCMPMGAVFPFKGIEKSMIILHGSQGCATYIRRHISEHYNEPIDVASSSLNEKGTVYGGDANLKLGLENMIKLYQPKIIGVLTSCLAETIGEDIDRICTEYLKSRDEKGEQSDIKIVTVATPGYGEGNYSGYYLATRRILEELVAAKQEKNDSINIIVPFISCADIRELKRLLKLMKVNYTLLPDYSDTLERPYTENYSKVPETGSKINQIEKMGTAKATIEIGINIDDKLSPGSFLEKEFNVPLYRTPYPLGLKNTDSLIKILSRLSGRAINSELELERGLLMDAMIDSHKYNFEGKSIIFGDPEIVYSITTTCLENGIHPFIVGTGSNNPLLQKNLESEKLCDGQNIEVLKESDFWEFVGKIENHDLNLAIGHSGGKVLTEKHGLPLVRMGYPVHDRVGGQRIMSLGYKGTSMFLDRVTNTLLENKYKNYRKKMYDTYFNVEDFSINYT